MAKIFLKRAAVDSALFYARLSLKNTVEAQIKKDEMNAAVFLHKAFAGINKTDSAYKYLLLANALKDSAFGYDQIKSMQLLNYNERSRIEKEAQQKIDAQLYALKLYWPPAFVCYS